MKSSFTGFDVLLYDLILYSLDVRITTRLDYRHGYDSGVYSHRYDIDFLINHVYITYNDIDVFEGLFK